MCAALLALTTLFATRYKAGSGRKQERLQNAVTHIAVCGARSAGPYRLRRDLRPVMRGLRRGLRLINDAERDVTSSRVIAHAR